MKSYIKFANKKAIANNPIQKLLYLVAYPITIISKTLGLTPNGVTLISCIFTLLAFGALVFNNLFSFLLFWFIAYVLDYVDGTLARMTNSKGKTALNIDHISDLLKISLIFLGFALYYNNQIIWVLTFIASVSYLIYTVLNHELVWNNHASILKDLLKNNNIKVSDKKSVDKIKQGIKYHLKEFIKKRPLLKQFILSFLSVFLTINGHTLIIFFLIPLEFNFAVILLIYFILLTTFQMIQRFKNLNKLIKIDV